MNTCVRCGNIRFNSWVVYRDHMKEMHDRLVFSPAKKYVPMDLADKQIEVTRGETTVRSLAWALGKYNPLIGCDKVSVEPEWDGERNIL
jgi:hypothetical protein